MACARGRCARRAAYRLIANMNQLVKIAKYCGDDIVKCPLQTRGPPPASALKRTPNPSSKQPIRRQKLDKDFFRRGPATNQRAALVPSNLLSTHCGIFKFDKHSIRNFGLCARDNAGGGQTYRTLYRYGSVCDILGMQVTPCDIQCIIGVMSHSVIIKPGRDHIT